MVGVSVRGSVLRRTEFGGSQATAASVRRLELELPTLSRPLTLRADGVSLALQQVRLPMVRAAWLLLHRESPYSAPACVHAHTVLLAC